MQGCTESAHAFLAWALGNKDTTAPFEGVERTSVREYHRTNRTGLGSRFNVKQARAPVDNASAFIRLWFPEPLSEPGLRLSDDALWSQPRDAQFATPDCKRMIGIGSTRVEAYGQIRPLRPLDQLLHRKHGLISHRVQCTLQRSCPLVHKQYNGVHLEKALASAQMDVSQISGREEPARSLRFERSQNLSLSWGFESDHRGQTLLCCTSHS